ncbi:MAG: quinone-dependent dihydroorotate dehydrogenase [Alphaproteobacteria bacterium]
MSFVNALAAKLLRAFAPETAHKLTLRLLRLAPTRPARADDPLLATTVWGKRFANPLGLAAGFDKDAEAMAPMLVMGFGFVEAGSITPEPQPGNPKPRVFRLPEDGAVINRYGFNSKGLANAARNFEEFRARGPATGIVGINLGKNKTTTDAASDYVKGARVLARYADYLVINVSSPNTPGLRALQDKEELRRLVAAVRAALPQPAPPLLVKIAPDLAEADRRDIAELALAGGLIDGLIVSNTTIARPASLRSANKSESGGLSGRPLMAPSTEVLREMYRLTGGRLPLIGVGGIASGADAYAKIRAGAALVQLYTAMAYDGPALIPRVKAELATLLKRDGFASVAAAVGADHKASQ